MILGELRVLRWKTNRCATILQSAFSITER